MDKERHVVTLCGCNGNPACPTAAFEVDGTVELSDFDQPNAGTLKLTPEAARQLREELQKRGY